MAIYRPAWSFIGDNNTSESIKSLVVILIVLLLDVLQTLMDLDASLVHICDQPKLHHYFIDMTHIVWGSLGASCNSINQVMFA